MGFLLHRLNLTAISVFRNCRRGFNLHKLKIPMSPRYCLYYTRNKEKYPFLFDGIHPTTKDARKASLRGLSAGFLGKEGRLVMEFKTVLKKLKGFKYRSEKDWEILIPIKTPVDKVQELIQLFREEGMTDWHFILPSEEDGEIKIYWDHPASTE